MTTNNKTLTFITYNAAHDWARTNARDHCHVYHYWKIVPTDDSKFAVAIHSKNTRKLEGYAHAN